MRTNSCQHQLSKFAICPILERQNYRYQLLYQCALLLCDIPVSVLAPAKPSLYCSQIELMTGILRNACFWVIIPFINFLVWRNIGMQNAPHNVATSPPITDCSRQPLEAPGIQMPPLVVLNYSLCPQHIEMQKSRTQTSSRPSTIKQVYLDETLRPNFDLLDTNTLDTFKGEELAHLKAHQKSVAINSYHGGECSTYVTITNTDKQHECVAVAHVSNLENAALLQRFTADSKKTGRELHPVHPKSSGYFRNVGTKKGRVSQLEKTRPLLEHLDEIRKEFDSMLSSRGINRGDDIVLMVANDGEIDLFLNFACSCRKHGISLHNVVLVAGSSEIVSIVEATGAMGFHHKHFASVERKASGGYLDKIFVQMMWYKAFSLWLSLDRGYNVLFQDLDLVWFKNPFEFFKEHRNSSQGEITAFLSDDGQRSLRYTPFYANSGFYYIVSTPSNINFAYSVMTAFDILQATGSHQNVFTFRLMENLDLIESHHMFLSLYDFPSGVKFHHDKKFMTEIAQGTKHPYIFHMCWTANKGQKLTNFKQVKMWYLQDKCNINSLVPPNGDLYKKISSVKATGKERQRVTPKDSEHIFETLSNQCCVFEDRQ